MDLTRQHLDLDPDIEQRVERQRLARLRAALGEHDLGAAVLFDSVNLRYACGVRNMQVNTMRNPGRYVFVPVEGPVVLFEYAACDHLSAGYDTVDEVRPAHALHPLYAGPVKYLEHLASFARDVAALVARHSPDNRRVAIDRPTTEAVPLLEEMGLTVTDATVPVDHAKAVKTEDEIQLIRASVRGTEAAVAHMEQNLVPGRSENEVWATLHEALIAGGGEYFETRLFSSGQRTNPWFQECSAKVIEPGDLVALDTDAIGCFGYFTDFSRTFLAGDGRPTDAQRRLYSVAREQLEHNLALLEPGLGFREFAERSWPIPEEYAPHRYHVTVHGNGLAGELPSLRYLMDWEALGYDGVFEPNMTVCVESFIGHRDGGEGVKLEEQVLINETGVERLSEYRFDERLSSG